MYLPNPFAWARCDTRSISKWSLTDLNSEFSFSKVGSHTKIKEPNLLYYSTITGGRIGEFISFPRILVRSEMQIILNGAVDYMDCVSAEG